jgi:hypothetical protein
MSAYCMIVHSVIFALVCHPKDQLHFVYFLPKLGSEPLCSLLALPVANSNQNAMKDTLRCGVSIVSERTTREVQ